MVELLYDLVAIGEPVKIISEPYLLGRIGDEWYFEGHAPLEDDTVDPTERLNVLLADATDELSAREADHVRALASVANGVPVRISALDDAEVLARVRRVHNTIEHEPDAPTLDEVRQMIDEAVAEAELAANYSKQRATSSGMTPQQWGPTYSGER